MKCLERLIRDRGFSADESDLIQRLPGAHLDGERTWNDFQEEGAMITCSDFVEPCVEICDDTREDIEAAGCALGIGPRADGLW